MVQETGETRDAIMEDDNKRIEEIIHANKHRTEPYYIVMYVTPSKSRVEGKYTLLKHIKPYPQRPRSMVGMIVGTVNNATGEISWEVNMHQKPFDYDRLSEFGAKTCDEVVVETTTIADSYLTR